MQFLWAIIILGHSGITTMDYTGSWNECQQVAMASAARTSSTAYCRPKDSKAYQEWVAHSRA